MVWVSLATMACLSSLIANWLLSVIRLIRFCCFLFLCSVLFSRRVSCFGACPPLRAFWWLIKINIQILSYNRLILISPILWRLGSIIKIVHRLSLFCKFRGSALIILPIHPNSTITGSIIEITVHLIYEIYLSVVIVGDVISIWNKFSFLLSV